ncbi:hypothetical protein O6P43_004240 [Quillaja saponaria]|uniref:Uncharacterized protein n=1 Tax=Quillaja saponaria TaxID=32244 RepID=A0AAD7Q3C6_QUISA|nr:hypothetical protein O6P43_004240 [Quillaja saponaria]
MESDKRKRGKGEGGNGALAALKDDTDLLVSSCIMSGHVKQPDHRCSTALLLQSCVILQMDSLNVLCKIRALGKEEERSSAS